MLRSLNSGVHGMKAFQHKIDVIGNNIANSNTTGYKSDYTSFADSFNQTLRHADVGVAAGNVNPIQVGSGVSLSGINSRFEQGTFTQTGNATDLAVDGDGFFMVKDPNTGAEFATRAGDFLIDSQSYLVTKSGFRVQGFTDASGTTRGDIQINATGAADPTASPASFEIGRQGGITVHMDDGTQFTRGTVLLQNFSNPQALTKEGGNIFSNVIAAGPLGGATPTSVAPGSNGTGTIISKHLEASNVDLAREFTDLITGQRGFQASARIITTSDDLLQEIVNLKR